MARRKADNVPLVEYSEITQDTRAEMRIYLGTHEGCDVTARTGILLLDRLDEIDPPPGQEGEYEKVLAAVRQKMNDLNLNRCQLDDGIACVEAAIQALADIVEGILQSNGK